MTITLYALVAYITYQSMPHAPWYWRVGAAATAPFSMPLLMIAVGIVAWMEGEDDENKYWRDW